mmetsp:Transcript_14789/g.22577  ORF Transcript_14789/g.22577 Transcript_14789/m.22577 type:complete len:132 (-) Transcript_14789:2676-3071(-)
MVKTWVSRWDEWGYQSRCRLVRASSVGGAIRQNRLIVVRLQSPLQDKWKWDSMELDQEIARPMSNLLTPPGLLRGVVYHWSESYIYPDLLTEPMPGHIEAWISTEKGNRRLTLDETGWGLGLSKRDSEEVT